MQEQRKNNVTTIIVVIIKIVKLKIVYNQDMANLYLVCLGDIIRQ